MNNIKNSIVEIIDEKMDELDRYDLYRQPIVGFSSIDDSSYEEFN